MRKIENVPGDTKDDTPTAAIPVDSAVTPVTANPLTAQITLHCLHRRLHPTTTTRLANTNTHARHRRLHNISAAKTVVGAAPYHIADLEKWELGTRREVGGVLSGGDAERLGIA